MGKRVLLVSWGLIVALAIAACAGQGPTAESQGGAAPSGGEKSVGGQTQEVESSGPDPSTGPQPGTASRDFENMDVCTVFPGDQLAAAMDAELGKEPAATDQGTSHPACWYWLVYGGSTAGIGDAYILYLEPPENFETYLSGMQDPQDVPGIGDQAVIDYRADAEDYSLAAVWQGDITVGVFGVDQDMVTKLAQYVMENLQ